MSRETSFLPPFGRVASSDLLKLEQALRLWFGLSG